MHVRNIQACVDKLRAHLDESASEAQRQLHVVEAELAALTRPAPAAVALAQDLVGRGVDEAFWGLLSSVCGRSRSIKRRRRRPTLGPPRRRTRLKEGRPAVRLRLPMHWWWVSCESPVPGQAWAPALCHHGRSGTGPVGPAAASGGLQMSRPVLFSGDVHM